MIQKILVSLLIVFAGLLLLYPEVDAVNAGSRSFSYTVPGSVVKAVFHDLTALLYSPQSAIQVELLAPAPAPALAENLGDQDLNLNFKYSHFIVPISSKYGVDWKLVASVMSVESNFNPRARSSKGALGLMQLMPRTAALYQLKPEDLLNPRKNIEAGVRHLSMLHKRFDGNLELMIAAYNCGEAAIDRFDGVPPYKHTRSFVRKVLARYKSPETFLKGSRVAL